MNFLKTTINLINKVYRSDPFVEILLKPVVNKLYSLNEKLLKLQNNFFFDTLNEDGCKYFEKLLDLNLNKQLPLSDKQANIQAKWNANNHNCIILLQNICNAWKNGEVEVNFINGKIQLKFIGEFGVPSDQDGLLNAINTIKPAHLGFTYIYKYLLIKDIHKIKTISQMETLTIRQFAFGLE